MSGCPGCVIWTWFGATSQGGAQQDFVCRCSFDCATQKVHSGENNVKKQDGLHEAAPPRCTATKRFHLYQGCSFPSPMILWLFKVLFGPGAACMAWVYEVCFLYFLLFAVVYPLLDFIKPKQHSNKGTTSVQQSPYKRFYSDLIKIAFGA